MTSFPEIISYHSADFELAVDAKLFCGSFAKFVAAAWEHVTGYEYTDCRHIDVLVRHLEGVVRGDITRLLANIPPGIFKTTVVSVLFPAWLWTRDQSVEFLFYSYNAGLATEASVKCRELLRSEWYQRLFPAVIVAPDDDTKQLFKLTGGGSRRAVPIGGTATGLHPDIIVIDDPNNRDEVNSFVAREAVREWYFSTLSSRGITKKVRHIVVQQRLHVEDLSGHVLAKHIALVREFGEDASPWVHVCLPMRFIPELAMKDHGYGGDWRTERDELLCPNILDDKAVTALERQLGPSQARAQLQQDPRRSDSGILKVNKLKSVTKQMLPRFDRLVRAWDLAATEGDGCFTAGILMGLQQGRSNRCESGIYSNAPATDLFYVLDVERDQTDDPIGLMKRTAIVDESRWGEVQLTFEDQPGGAGKILTKQIRDQLRQFNPKPVRPLGSKEQRADALSGAIRFGELMVLSAEWTPAYIAELERFPALPCDQVDASSLGYQALIEPQSKGAVCAAPRSTKPSESERCKTDGCKRPAFLNSGHCCEGCHRGEKCSPACCNSFTNWFNSRMPTEHSPRNNRRNFFREKFR